MESANRIVATLPVKDQERADKFYVEVLGLKASGEDLPGGTLLVGPGGGEVFLYETENTSGEATSLAINVTDFDAAANSLREAGIKFESYDNIPGESDTEGVYLIGDAKTAWFKDSEGNTLNIISM